MSELKCPFCQQELERDYDKIQCPDINCRHKHDWYGSYDLWRELIRTRKALDIAKEALNNIQFTDDGNKIIDIRSFAHHVFDQITALEQKN